MPSVPPHRWPSEASYRYLDTAAPAEIAWEWLRRDPDYCALALDSAAPMEGDPWIARAASATVSARWGCLNTPSPGKTWAESPVLWSSSIEPAVLTVMAVPADDADEGAFDLRRWRAMATLASSPSGEHFLLQNARSSVRLDVVSGTLRDGPVMLFHDLARIGLLEPKLAALRRFHHLCRTGHFPAVTGSPTQQSRRQILALRTHDAIAQGASIRDIGSMLHGDERIRAEWPGSGDAFKSQARRLIALAREMAGGGYRRLLGRLPN